MRYWFFLSLITLGSCGILEHERTDGIYRVRAGREAAEKRYVSFSADTITIYPLTPAGAPDPQRARVLVVAETGPPTRSYRYRLAKTSVDLDLTTVLFKYRAPTAGLPAQFNTQFNFAVYSGYRRDYFTFRYRQDLLGRNRLKYRHWGWDAGLLAGMGTTPVNPWVTRQAVEAEYDGLTLQTGVAAFAGFNNLAAGICLGMDYLTDTNRQHWIYHKKPWIGLAIGLALN